ncbi:MAG: type II secretion system secretin GspD [Mariprofundaceae bacterium]
MKQHKISIWLVVACLWLLPESTSAQEVTLNFRDADIQSVIKFVAEFSGQNFLVDNRVRGKVTVISPKAISSRDAYEVFLSILRINGFAAVPAGEVVKIIPISDGKQAGGEVRSRGKPKASDALITQIVPVESADAQQLVNVLRPLMSPAGNLVAYAPANLLIITEAAVNVRRMMEIVETLDVADVVGFKMFSLRYAAADKMVQTLNELYGRGRAGIAARGNKKGQRQIAAEIKMISYEPANVLIVVAPSNVISEIDSLVTRLDVEPKPDAGRLQVRYLRNANAEDVAKVLTGVITDASAGKSAGKGGVLPKAVFSGDVKVTPDPTTNALLILADPVDRDSINKIIDKLDIRRLQVFVEGLIVEVGGDTLKQFGVEWAVGKDFTNAGVAVLGGQNFGSLSSLGSAVGNNTGSALGGAVATALSSGLTAGIIRGSLAGGNATIGGIVRALERNADSNVLSTPNLLMMDNEQAEIIVGQNVPFVTGQNSTQGGTSNPFQTIERKDIGLTLRVTPQISEGDTIRLDLYQEVSSIAPSSTSADASDIITNKRSIKTVVLANDGEIIVLGGLIRDDASESVQKVPCIGSVPILGEPFKFTEITQRKTNLMVFLRPHIINSTDDIKVITQEKYLEIKDLYNQRPTGGTMLFPYGKRELPVKISPLPLLPSGEPAGE